MTSQRDLEQRLQTVEDVEAIRRLVFKFGEAIDANFDLEALEPLFLPEAVLDQGPLGLCEGWDAIKRSFAERRVELTFTRHFYSGSLIDVGPSDDEASGKWYLWEVATFRETPTWIAMTYDDRYRRLGPSWRFEYRRLNMAFFTPYDKGWVQQPFMV